MKDKASVAVHFSRWEDGAFGCCTKCLHVILACADTCRMWPVAKSALCVCAWSLRVQLTAPPHPDMHKQCHIVCSRARLGLCVRLPSDHKEGDRACLCVCVCLPVLYFRCDDCLWGNPQYKTDASVFKMYFICNQLHKINHHHCYFIYWNFFISSTY